MMMNSMILMKLLIRLMQALPLEQEVHKIIEDMNNSKVLILLSIKAARSRIGMGDQYKGE
jgi:hypothetical protein